MTIATTDDYLTQNAPSRPQELPPELTSARASLNSALAALRAVPDSALEKKWSWRGHELDVRYGLYAQYEALEGARAEVTRMLEAGVQQGPARALVAATTSARWDVHGVLVGLDDADLDRDPGNGEWTLRQTLGHIVGGQRQYAWGTAWWLARRDAPEDDYPDRIPAEFFDQMPSDDDEAVGSIAEIRHRFDDVCDVSCGVFSGIDEAALASRSRWSRMPIDVRFRVRRWPSHIREHTIQLEKTLGFMGRPITEVERLLRLIAGAYGRLEEEVFFLDAPAALALVEAAAGQVATDAPTVRAAAEA